MSVLLGTERLVLREFVAADVDHLVELDSDPEVMHFITAGRPTPRHEIEDGVLPAWLAYYQRSACLGYWAVEERATGQFLGWFHFRPGEGHGDVEYALTRAEWEERRTAPTHAES